MLVFGYAKAKRERISWAGESILMRRMEMSVREFLTMLGYCQRIAPTMRSRGSCQKEIGAHTPASPYTQFLLAPRDGLEPPAKWLTATRSTS